jgi:hypothetical protein
VNSRIPYESVWPRKGDADAGGRVAMMAREKLTLRQYRDPRRSPCHWTIAAACIGAAALCPPDRVALCYLPHRFPRTDAVRPPLRAWRLHAERRGLEGPTVCGDVATDFYEYPGRPARRCGTGLWGQQQFRHAADEPLSRWEDHREFGSIHPGNVTKGSFGSIVLKNVCSIVI